MRVGFRHGFWDPRVGSAASTLKFGLSLETQNSFSGSSCTGFCRQAGRQAGRGGCAVRQAHIMAAQQLAKPSTALLACSAAGARSRTLAARSRTLAGITTTCLTHFQGS